MLEILQNLFVLPLIAACVIMVCVYGYIKVSHKDELYEKRDYVRYFLSSYLISLATYYVYQKFMGDAASTSGIQSGGGGESSSATSLPTMEDVADSAEALMDSVAAAPSATYNIATNIMERFNTGRPTF
jgi:hypothetical protein